MTTWDPQRLQEQFKRHERFKQGAADRCKAQIRFGKADYRRFYDEEVAEEMIAFVLGTDAALESRDLMLNRLNELRKTVAEGKFDASGIYDKQTFRDAAIDFIDRLTSRFSDPSRPPDIQAP